MGLVARVVPRAELRAETHALAALIAGNAPLAVRHAKRAIDRGMDLAIEEGIGAEDAAWREAVATRDRAEGIAAFVEKRPPSWSGS